VVEGGKALFEFVGADGTKRVEEYTPRARGGQDGGLRGGGQRGGRGGEQPPRERPNERPNDRPRRGEGGAPKSGLVVESAGVLASGLLDPKFTCDGDSISPPLAWRGLPADTKSVAVSMHHVPPEGGEHVYMVVWDIPADAKGLDAGARSFGSWGQNTVNRRAEYAPPCSQGPGDKTYTITLYALSADAKLPAASTPLTRDALLAAIKNTTLGTTTLAVKYARAVK